MKFKKILIGTAVACALIVPTATYAATSTSTTAIKIRGLFGIDTSNLTSAQQADITDYANKMADLQKSLIDKMVSDGLITQAQADAKKAQIDTNLANGDIFIGGGKGGDVHGGINSSKLTDAQKSTLLTLEKQQLTMETDLADLLVGQKLITQTQANTIKTQVNTATASLTTSNLGYDVMRNGKVNFNMLQGVTLTDSQKSALKGWTAKAAEVQKKIVTLYKDAGAITQTQADTMNTQIDTKAADPLSFIMNGNGNNRGGRRGH